MDKSKDTPVDGSPASETNIFSDRRQVHLGANGLLGATTLGSVPVLA
jgi:hypothetical protein